MYNMYKHKVPPKAVIKMHTLNVKATSFYGRSEYIAIIIYFKLHCFSPCLIYESVKGFVN